MIFLHQNSTTISPVTKRKCSPSSTVVYVADLVFLWKITSALWKRGCSCNLRPSLSSSDVREKVNSTICEAIITLPFHSTARRQHSGPGVLCASLFFNPKSTQQGTQTHTAKIKAGIWAQQIQHKQTSSVLLVTAVVWTLSSPKKHPCANRLLQSAVRFYSWETSCSTNYCSSFNMGLCFFYSRPLRNVNHICYCNYDNKVLEPFQSYFKLDSDLSLVVLCLNVAKQWSFHNFYHACVIWAT